MTEGELLTKETEIKDVVEDFRARYRAVSPLKDTGSSEDA